mgnify:FL=1
MQYLTITTEQYFKAYNDYEFIFNYTTDYNGLSYLSWSAARVLLKEYYPSYEPFLEVDDNNNYLFKLTNNLVDKELAAKNLTVLEAKLEDTKDFKEKKKMLAAIEEVKSQLLYDNRGLIIKPYLLDTETGLRTASLHYPLMDSSNNSIFNPDARDINDNIQRAYVKVIAVASGLGLRLYSRQGIGKDLEESNMVKVIKAIVDRSETLGVEVDKSVVNFGTNYTVLRQLAIDLKQKLDS